MRILRRPKLLWQALYLWFVLALYLLTIGWTLKAGKDLNFDQLNYHLYGPHLLLQNRWALDYFAASLQTYLNGVSYVPFYWMVMAGWNDRLIAIILATVHFLNILLVLALARRVLRGSERMCLLLASIAGALAIVAPMYLVEVGTSFNDPLASIFVLSALLIYTRQWEDRQALWTFTLTGACLGVAIGIKLTNGVFLCGMIVVMAADCLTQELQYWRTAISRVLVFGVGCVVGFLLLHGYWSWKLFENFGSPIFPYFNNLFHAPDYPSIPIQDRRFLGSGWLGLFVLPFEMIRSEAWIYTETSSPDVRFAALLCLLLAALVMSTTIKGKAHALLSWHGKKRSSTTIRRIAIFFVVSFLVWGGLFRIGRYAFVLWLLLPVLIVAVLQARVLSRYAVALGLLILLIQTFINVENRLERWDGAQWSGRWLDFDMPPEFSEPSNAGVFLTVETQSLSALALPLSRNAALINLMGQHVLPSGANMKPRLQTLLQNQERPKYLVRSFHRAEYRRQQIDWGRVDWSALDSVLLPYGLKVARGTPCAQGALNFSHMNIYRPSDEGDGYDIYFCRLEQASAKEISGAIARQTQFDELFDRLERLCPQSFYPPTSTVLIGGEHLRSYFNTGTHMKTIQGELYATAFRRLESVKLADLNNPLSNPLPSSSSCPPLIVHRYLR